MYDYDFGDEDDLLGGLSIPLSAFEAGLEQELWWAHNQIAPYTIYHIPYTIYHIPYTIEWWPIRKVAAG